MNVLYVDDEDGLQAGMRDELAEYGISVTCASSASLALSLIESHKFDAVVSDFNMPNISGVELFAQVRKSHEKLPFFLITGGIIRATEERLILQAGVTAILSKPVTFSSLARTLRETNASGSAHNT